MSSNISDPGPCDRDGPLPIRQTDHEQLMTETNFGPIYDQTELSQGLPLGLKPLLGDRPIPLPHIESRIIQKTAQAPRNAHQLRFSRDLHGDPAQTDRMTLINTDHQPHEVS